MAGSEEELNVLFIYKNIKIKMMIAVEARMQWRNNLCCCEVGKDMGTTSLQGVLYP